MEEKVQEAGAKKTDCEKYSCDYKLPHYHCKIKTCGKKILEGDGDPHQRFHPCCSSGHIRIYNATYVCNICIRELSEPGAKCYNCGSDKNSAEYPKINVRPVTDIAQYRQEHCLPNELPRREHARSKERRLIRRNLRYRRLFPTK